MADDWKVGDLALCVDNGPRPNNFGVVQSTPNLQEGATYLVRQFGGNGLFVSEVLAPNEPYWGFNPARFRKIRPDEHEDCEPEFVELLNRIKRKIEA